MTTDENKALVRRFITEVFEQGRVEAVEELCAPDFIGHTWGNADREGLKLAMARVATGRSYTIGEIHIFQLRDGQVSEHWHEFDRTGLIRQLGGS